MALFHSGREKRLWLWTLAVVAAIYTTIPVVRPVMQFFRDRGLLDNLYFTAFLVVIAAAAVHGFRKRPSVAEIAIAVGVLSAWLMVFLRMSIPEERTHLFEYGVVGICIFEALKERKSAGGNVRLPILTAIGVTTIIGVGDECIQGLVPGRYFDWRDILFNFIAGTMTISGSALLAWARKKFTKS